MRGKRVNIKAAGDDSLIERKGLVMNINSVGPVDPVSKQNKANKVVKPASTGGTDSIQISSDAKAMAEVYNAAETVKASPDVRMDRIAEVKEKLKDPSYIDNKIIESVADSVMDMFGLS
jgi:negative regulator of flagellin synthesis FlgM